MISIVVGVVIALGVLVTFHEFGHFCVARRCGVEVLRFSIGFGKPLFRWHDRRGTEFVVAMIPLGGYVKMLDERETDESVDPAKLPYAFNRKSLTQRAAIVAAGPLANLLLAFFLFWVVALIGSKEVMPVIGEVQPLGIAETAGLKPSMEIVAVDGVKTYSWTDVAFQLLQRLGETGTIVFQAKNTSEQIRDYKLLVHDWQRGVEKPNPFDGLGFKPYHPVTVPKIIAVEKQSPAAKAGLQAGDVINSFNGEAVSDWFLLTEGIRKLPDHLISLGFKRSGKQYITEVNLSSIEVQEGKVGYLGVRVEPPKWPEQMIRQVNLGVVASMGKALEQTWSFSVMTLVSIKKMIVGQMSVKNVSGPIGIAKVAGESIDSGVVGFLKFLALFSVSLGVFNLLPIPLLDGGHLLFFAIEWFRGAPVSARVQEISFQGGMFLMLGIMLFTIMNDLSWL